MQRAPLVLSAPKALISPDLAAALRAKAQLCVDPADVGRADAILASAYLPVDASVLAQAPQLAVVTHIGSAIHTDVAAATAHGVVVLHNPGRNADSVAEHTIALLLAGVKQIPRSDREVRARVDWDVAAPHLVTHELRGKTLGIVGFGAIGRRVAEIASLGLGMRVIGCGRTPGSVRAAGYDELPLDELLPRIDVLSVHAAANSTTTNLIDRRRLCLLPPHAWVINTARADVLDYDALADLLRAGRLAGAAVDTWPEHRADPYSPLIDLPNVVLTQHNAGFTHEAAARMVSATAAGLWEALAGTYPRTSTLVNPQVWQHRRRPDPNLVMPSDC